MSVFEFVCSDAESTETDYDMCSCSNCGWKGKVEGLDIEQEQDGWENPPYSVHLCHVCEDGGCIDDYWRSEDD